jgi:uncharacterized protein YbaR (Trm112 family)
MLAGRPIRPLEIPGVFRDAERHAPHGPLSTTENAALKMMLNNETLTILRCPENRMRLSPASDETMRRVNAAIRDGRIVNRGGQILERSLDGGLVREDDLLLYPIVDGIPVLLRDDAIFLEQLGD